MSQANGIQLQMNFDTQSIANQFQKQVYSADFTILFELSVPSFEADLNSTINRLAPMIEFITAPKEFPCGISFVDANPDFRSFPIVEFASAVAPENRDSHVIYLSGRGKDEESAAGFLAQCRLEGFKNVVCVSGMPSVKQKNGRVYESVKMLQLNLENENPLFAGAVVNPFKYEVCSSIAQTLYLEKKARAGASFAVTQFGWDLAKLQEISWHMQRNSCNIPLFARQMLLTPAMAVDLCTVLAGITVRTAEEHRKAVVHHLTGLVQHIAQHHDALGAQGHRSALGAENRIQNLCRVGAGQAQNTDGADSTGSSNGGYGITHQKIPHHSL